MNTNESDFEKELRTLAPSAPSAHLLQRISAELPTTRAITVGNPRTLSQVPANGTLVTNRPPSLLASLLRGLLWAGAGATATAVILMARAPQPASLTTAAPPAVEAPAVAATTSPEETVSELISAADEGLFLDDNSAEPQRQMRLTYLERHVWTNPQTGAVIEFEVPREDIVMMPVAMQ